MGAHATYEDAERRLFERYGLEPESRFVELKEPNLRVRVIEIGAGDPVVLVHGLALQAAVWAPLLAELRGFRLVAVDCPGCGLTEQFLYTGVDVRRHAVAFLSSLLDALGLQQTMLVGHSLGALFSLYLAGERPERVSSLALIDPALVLDMSGGPFVLRLLSVRGLNRLMLALQPPTLKRERALMKQLVGERAAERMDPEYIDVAYRGDVLPGAGATFRTLLERLGRLRGVRPGVSFREEELRRIEQPVLFVWGDADIFGGPEYGRRACAAMPNARLEVVDAGHLPWWDDPGRCGELVSNFLRASA